MRFLAAVIAFCTLCPVTQAGAAECKSLTDPATRLACYDKANPPLATFPTPPPKPAPRAAPAPNPAQANPAQAQSTQAAPARAPKVDSTGYVDQLSQEDARLNAQMKTICRGC